MFETLLASLGVGSAKIDLILDKPYVTAGEKVTGKIIVKGGSTEQTIEGLSVNFKMESHQAANLNKITEKIAAISISEEPFTVQPDEIKTFPFHFTCPNHIPFSSISTKYFFDSDLEILRGIDSHDRDYIKVLPTGMTKLFLDGLDLLGFKPKWEALTPEQGRWGQIIHFQPTTHFAGKFNQVAFYLQPGTSDQELEFYYDFIMKVTEDHGALFELFHLNEKEGKYTFTADEISSPEQAKIKIEALIKSSLLHT
ncbi:sporulation protein [Thermoflavimicrobium dichotomicum]|uniref:Sporulation-control protein n=1 Tax=Thermoflavimicrobium dichotomicum TaxID=46223 RepID=A0A1I3MYI1_9BACL|nr:sporulation protein [Thermoflavimicrobium dichotomicum]SFJ01726.1 sporulation-control protein [Thermoflavimicrobium dichotomicum]